ncbi:PREDICTED: uncharacterized protein LOC106819773 [Priapulus caudatus]|uniref:Uncharacterized protein LOC106819773 n=1 Tax=Priapulus caudatus TaxID=37621 RepID=A0ABM1F5X6_PRICU|nr:PREDICTED: uncharacterized protein LOC106819773 [Priapulus caudatus]
MQYKFIITSVLETMRLFEAHGFHVSCLVFDGASTNLSAAKVLTTGRRGRYKDEPGTHIIQPWFTNPFQPRIKVHIVICPSHQLKNMVNALFASRTQGPKDFVSLELCGEKVKQVPFGWKAIKDLYEREVDRRDKNRLRMVPGLQKSFVIRDSWTKLNVRPAKIMQQERVLAELATYAQPEYSTCPPWDSGHVMAAHTYLSACNMIFERGLLSHSKVTSNSPEALDNIMSGWSYFSRWRNSLEDLADFKPSSNKERRFLAWQTWDLLRITIFGFRGLCEDFFSRHGPNYFISPLRINGSAVESLFSRLKAYSGGKLTSINYQSARKSIIIQGDVKHPSGEGYRDVPLYHMYEHE